MSDPRYGSEAHPPAALQTERSIAQSSGRVLTVGASTYRSTDEPSSEAAADTSSPAPIQASAAPPGTGGTVPSVAALNLRPALRGYPAGEADFSPQPGPAVGPSRGQPRVSMPEPSPEVLIDAALAGSLGHRRDSEVALRQSSTEPCAPSGPVSGAVQLNTLMSARQRARGGVLSALSSGGVQHESDHPACAPGVRYPASGGVRGPGQRHLPPTVSEDAAARKLQRLWRGYWVRRELEIICRQGRGSCKDLDRLRLLRSAFSSGEGHAAPVAGLRHLPVGPYGAYHACPQDTSRTRIRQWECIKFFSLGGGNFSRSSIRSRCANGLCYCVLCLWTLGTAGATYLIPGWVSLCFKLVFQDGHTTLRIDQFVTWLMLFAAACGVGVCTQLMVLAYEQERFARRLDTVFAIMARKNPGMLSLEQLRQLRGVDLGTTKSVLYNNIPLAFFHGVHVIMGMVTVWVFSWPLGLVTTGSLGVAGGFLTGYDRLVLAQQQLLHHINLREGRFYCPSGGFEPSGLQETPADAVQLQREAHGGLSTRDYQLIISKSIVRMNRVFARVHWAVAATVLLLCSSVPVFFFHVGAAEVESGELARHDFIFCFVYFVFTMVSAWRFNTNFCAVWLARARLTRTLKLAWHFRDFSDQRTFFENECQAVAQTYGKHHREQPPTPELFVLCATFVLFMVIWIIYFMAARIDTRCGEHRVECWAWREPWGWQQVGYVNQTYGFDFYEGCAPREAMAETLLQCAKTVAAAHSDPTVPGFLPVGERFTASIAYLGWRLRERGMSKNYYLANYTISLQQIASLGIGSGLSAGVALSDNSSVMLTDVCPHADLFSKPFRDVFHMTDDRRSSLGWGKAAGLAYRSVPQVFFRENFYEGCYNITEVPEGACASPTGLRRCWCDWNTPSPLPFPITGNSPCSCIGLLPGATVAASPELAAREAECFPSLR